jgi:hypothetical protein
MYGIRLNLFNAKSQQKQKSILLAKNALTPDPASGKPCKIKMKLRRKHSFFESCTADRLITENYSANIGH